MKKKLLLATLIGLFILQFIPMDKTNPPLTASNDFIQMTQAPPAVAQLLKAACYDCHSNESVYPNYTKIQPVGYWIRGHIRGARKHLNFSEWAIYPAKKRAHKIEECIEEIEGKSMPLKSYTWMHESAKLSAAQSEQLLDWLKTQGR